MDQELPGKLEIPVPVIPARKLCPTKAGTDHRRHIGGHKKHKKESLCAFCVPSPICWAKPPLGKSTPASRAALLNFPAAAHDRAGEKIVEVSDKAVEAEEGTDLRPMADFVYHDMRDDFPWC